MSDLLTGSLVFSLNLLNGDSAKFLFKAGSQENRGEKKRKEKTKQSMWSQLDDNKSYSATLIS